MAPTKPKQVRITPELERRVEEHAQRLRSQAPAVLRVTWSDAARDLLERGLEAVEVAGRGKARR